MVRKIPTLVAGRFEAMAHNNMLEPTRLSKLEIEGGFGFVHNLPAEVLLQTRLAAQHCRYAALHSTRGNWGD